MRTDDQGVPYGDTWEYAAARGSEIARQKLESPEFPDALGYLWLWAAELFGKSGHSATGIDGLTYTTVRDWSELTGQHPTPREVDALMKIDAAMRGSGSGDADDVVGAAPVQRVDLPWPEKTTDG